MPYITPPGLIYSKTGNLYLLSTFIHFAPHPPNHQTVLRGPWSLLESRQRVTVSSVCSSRICRWVGLELASTPTPAPRQLFQRDLAPGTPQALPHRPPPQGAHAVPGPQILPVPLVPRGLAPGLRQGCNRYHTYGPEWGEVGVGRAMLFSLSRKPGQQRLCRGRSAGGGRILLYRLTKKIRTKFKNGRANGVHQA